MTSEEAAEAKKFLIDLQVAMFRESVAYNNVIIGAGYVAVFTLWHFAKDRLGAMAANCSVILLGLSMVSYIGWTTLNMVRLWRARFQFPAQLAGLEGPAFVARYRELESDHQRSSFGWYMKAWAIVVAFAVLTAFAALAIMIWTCAWNLAAL